MRRGRQESLLLALMLSVAWISRGAGAQPQATARAPLALSLEEALRIAERTSEQVAIARAAVSRAKAQGLQSRSELFPQVSLTGTYERTLASEYRDLFANASGFGSTLEELPFGQLNTWNFGVTATQNLFAGGRTFARMRVAGAQGRQSEVALASTRAQVVLDTAQAYFDALLADQLLANAQATLQQQLDTFEQTRAAKEAGTKPEFDVLRARVAVDNQRPVVLRQRVNRDLAYLRLRQTLDLGPEVSLSLTTALGDGEPPPLDALVQAVARTSAEVQAGPRAPVQEAQSRVDARAAGVSLATSSFYPQLDVGTAYGRVAYPSALFPGWSDFRTNWNVSLLLRIPVFTGFRTLGEVRVAQADLSDARQRLQETEEQSRLDAVAAKDELDTAVAVWKASTGTVEEARRAYEIADLRYREGVSTQLELADARLLLRQAEANRARAARDLQVARIRLALLPLLPLSAQPGMAGLSFEVEATTPAPAATGVTGF